MKDGHGLDIIKDYCRVVESGAWLRRYKGLLTVGESGGGLDVKKGYCRVGES